jgi:Spy/CpxP family protein refolding chaperone
MIKLYYPVKKVLTFAFLLIAFSSAFAQGPPPSQDGDGPPSPPSPQQMEKVKTMKIGFLTEKINLTSDEAKVFWPIYNKYQDELDQLRKSRRDNLENAKKNFDEMSDKDVEKTIDAELAFRQNELNVVKKYNPEFKKVLPMKKVAKLYRAEEDFKRKLLEMLQERKMDRKDERRQERSPK